MPKENEKETRKLFTDRDVGNLCNLSRRPFLYQVYQMSPRAPS